MSKRVRCLHCREVLPVAPAMEVARIHVGPGEPAFADPSVVGAIMQHASRHEPRAWIEGRDYVVVDDEMNETPGVCERHGLEIVEEPGGPDMPTVHGRRYCPACQAEFNAALDEHDTERTRRA